MSISFLLRSDFKFELQQVSLTISVCLNALSWEFFLLLRLTVQNVLVFWRHDLFIHIHLSLVLNFFNGWAITCKNVIAKLIFLKIKIKYIGMLSHTQLYECNAQWNAYISGRYTSKVEDINREESLNSFNGWLTLWTSSSAIGQLSRSRLICCGQGWALFLLKR